MKIKRYLIGSYKQLRFRISADLINLRHKKYECQELSHNPDSYILEFYGVPWELDNIKHTIEIEYKERWRRFRWYSDEHSVDFVWEEDWEHRRTKLYNRTIECEARIKEPDYSCGVTVRRLQIIEILPLRERIRVWLSKSRNLTVLGIILSLLSILLSILL